MLGLIQNIGAIGDVPGDDSEALLKHRILLFAGLLMSSGGLLWGLICVYFGLLWQSFIPFGYVVTTAANFLFLMATKDFRVARDIQITASLLLPFAFQWGLGGFIASGAVMLWAMLALIGVLALSRPVHGWFWLASYIALIILSVLLEPRLSIADGLGAPALSTVFFAMNTAVVTSIVFLLTHFFVQRRNQALLELEASKNALVQSEKMAALGQLTAGVAHEIKNPLNFMNNFSDTSVELLEELRVLLEPLTEQVEKDRADEINELIEFLTSDLGSIASHGKRADSIIRNMLQHARRDSALLVETDINEIVAEASNLAYHAERAVDSEFEVKLGCAYVVDLPTIKVAPQALTRVLINLYANAFFSVRRKNEIPADGFIPTVTTTTRRQGSGIEILIRDNGIGIPAAHLDRLFEPFFTTKSPGEGTGLGLSISHEIVAKQLGGTLSAISDAGEYAEFKIWLPL